MRALALALILAVAPVASGAAAQTWEALPPMQTARAGAAVAVLGGRLYVMGGTDASGAILGTAEVYDPASGLWTFTDELRDERTDAAAAVLNGRIVLVGGRDDDGEATDNAETYDDAGDDWESFEHIETARQGLGLAALGGGLYALGGVSESGALLGSCEYYDSDWTAYAPWTIQPPRADFGLATVGEALILAGGFSTFGPLDRVERYVPGSAAEPLAPLPLAVGALAFAATPEAAWAVGGRDAGDAVRAEVQRYGFASGVWTASPPLPSPREGARAAILGQDLVVVGGRDAFGTPLATVLRLPGVATPREVGPPEARVSLRLAGAHPVRGRAEILAHTAEAGPLAVQVVDARGRLVATRAHAAARAGEHRFSLDSRGWASGIYLVRLVASGEAATLRLVVAR